MVGGFLTRERKKVILRECVTYQRTAANRTQLSILVQLRPELTKLTVGDIKRFVIENQV